MTKFLNIVPVKTLTSIIMSIRDHGQLDEAKAQNTATLYFHLEQAMNGVEIPDFYDLINEQIDVEGVEFGKDLNQTDRVNFDNDFDHLEPTLEMLYIATFAHLMVNNLNVINPSSDGATLDFVSDCAKKAFQLIMEAAESAYNQDNDAVFLSITQTQKAILNINNCLLTHTSAPIFDRVGKAKYTFTNESIINYMEVGQIIMWWSLELSEEFIDAPSMYI